VRTARARDIPSVDAARPARIIRLPHRGRGAGTRFGAQKIASLLGSGVVRCRATVTAGCGSTGPKS
jgi:hypothetical protein